jgi:DNA-binding CsgD family transcriptional regulator
VTRWPATAAHVDHHDAVVISPSAPWPFVGRQRELRAAVDELLDPASAGVLVVGPAGVGKTRLLDEITNELTTRGRLWNRCVGAASTQPIPYAAIAHLVPKEALTGEGPPDPNHVFNAIRRKVRQALPNGPRFVMVIDDIPLLDTASLTLCAQLANAGVAAVLATVRLGQALPPALRALESTQPIARIEVAPFDVDGVIELLEAVQGGTVDRRTSRALWSASQGNLLYLRELVLGALASGAVASERGHWRLVAPLRATSKLVEAVTERLDGLPAPGRELAELLALAEPLRVEDLDDAGFGDAALLLDGAGLVTSADVEGTTVVRLAHPLYGEVLRSQLTPLRQRALLLRAAGAVSAARRPEDTLRVATWLVTAKAPVDPAVLRDAARRARAANDFGLTERLARVAAEHDPDIDVLILLSEALHEFGRIDEADRVLEQAAGRVDGDADRLRVAVLRHRVRLWGSSDAAASLAVLREAASQMAPGPHRSLVHVAIANTIAFDHECGAALDALSPDEWAEPHLAGLGAFSRSVVLARLGDPVAAADVAAAAQTGSVPDRHDREMHPALLILAEGLARGESGDLDGADAVVTLAYEAVAQQHIPQLHAWLTLQLGRIALHRGHPGTAKRWFAEALASATETAFAPGRRMALTGLAACAGHVGDVHAAATLLAELDNLAPDIGFLAPEVELGRAWALVALGRTTDAVAALRAGAARAAATGDAMLRHELLYEAARIGGADSALRAELAETTVTGDLAAARGAFVDGVVTGSRESLAAAEAMFASMGADLPAAEAAAALAVELQRVRRPREAAAATGRSAGHQRRCEGASTPMLLRRADSASLTPREREAALLAARGMATKAIARDLGVSERTVSNHLQNAYVKLGISTRADLAEALGL